MYETYHDGKYWFIDVPNLHFETLLEAMPHLSNAVSTFEGRVSTNAETRENDDGTITIRYKIEKLA